MTATSPYSVPIFRWKKLPASRCVLINSLLFVERSLQMIRGGEMPQRLVSLSPRVENLVLARLEGLSGRHAPDLQPCDPMRLLQATVRALERSRVRCRLAQHDG